MEGGGFQARRIGRACARTDSCLASRPPEECWQAVTLSVVLKSSNSFANKAARAGGALLKVLPIYSAMNPTSRLGRQLSEILHALNEAGVRSALIGGLALSSHKVIRATQDVDLLVELEAADVVEREVARLGYRRLYRTTEVGNYQRRDERLDFLYASRPIARRLLADAAPLETSLGRICVISGEGLIGFKLQSLTNDSRRTQDLEDIKALINANRETLNMEEVREYFKLFNREALLDELLR